MSALMQQYGGLASLAGVSLPGARRRRELNWVWR